MTRTPGTGHPRRADDLELVGPRSEIALVANPLAQEPASPVSPSGHRGSEVVVVTGVGRLADIVADLGRAVLFALAEDPRAVVCDLTGVTHGSRTDARLLLATTGQPVRDWPAVPVAMSCPDPVLRSWLRHQPMSEHVLLRARLPQALAAVDRSARRRPRGCGSRPARQPVG